MARSTQSTWVAFALLLGAYAQPAAAQDKPGAPAPAAGAAPAAPADAPSPAADKPATESQAEPVAPVETPPESGVAYATPAEPAPAVGWANPGDASAAEASVTEGVPPNFAEPPPPPRSRRDPLSLIGLYYSTAASVGDTRDFAGGFSWGGFTFDGRQRVYDRLAVGVSLGWQYFHYKSYRTTTVGNLTVTGVQARQQTVFPMLATLHYSFKDDAQVAMPFVGLGLGAYAVNRLVDIGPAARFTDNSWHLGFAPEVGVALPGRSGSMLVACKFHYAFKTDDAPKQTYFNFSVGGAFDD